jgi:REP element-mobilizing transposase RayT
LAGVPHHVTQCTNNRQRAFFADDDRRLYLTLFNENADPFGPPLCINEAQLDVGLTLFDEAVATVV